MDKYVLSDAPTSLDFAQLVPAQDNSRKMAEPDAEEYLGLVESLRNYGPLPTFPLVVKPRADGKYDVIDGNHRLRGMETLRLEDPSHWQDVLLPVIVVRPDTPVDAVEKLSIMQNAASASNITAKLSDVIKRCAKVVSLFFVVFSSKCCSRVLAKVSSLRTLRCLVMSQTSARAALSRSQLLRCWGVWLALLGTGMQVRNL